MRDYEHKLREAQKVAASELEFAASEIDKLQKENAVTIEELRVWQAKNRNPSGQVDRDATFVGVPPQTVPNLRNVETTGSRVSTGDFVETKVSPLRPSSPI